MALRDLSLMLLIAAWYAGAQLAGPRLLPDPQAVALDLVFTQLLPLDYDGFLLGMAYKNSTPYYVQLSKSRL